MVKADNDSEAFVVEFLRVLSTGNLEKLRPMVHEEATWEPMGKSIPGAGLHVGRKGIIDDFLGPVRGLFHPGEPKVEILNMISKGNQVAAETRGVGTLNNGKKYDNRYVWIFELKDGQLYRLREYMDTAYILTVVD